MLFPESVWWLIDSKASTSQINAVPLKIKCSMSRPLRYQSDFLPSDGDLLTPGAGG